MRAAVLHAPQQQQNLSQARRLGPHRAPRDLVAAPLAVARAARPVAAAATRALTAPLPSPSLNHRRRRSAAIMATATATTTPITTTITTSSDWARAHCPPDHADSLPALLAAIEAACRRISSRVQRAGIEGLHGYSSGSATNASGDAQKKLDVLSDEIFAAGLESSGLVRCYASEEAEQPVVLSTSSRARYVVAFDPLDGSRNVDVAIPTGTIFGVYESKAWRRQASSSSSSSSSYGPADALNDVLQPGSRQLASGYCLYSSAVVLALAMRTDDDDNTTTPTTTAAAFSLDTLTGDFVATHAPLLCPTRGQIYSLNDARFDDWPAGLQRYIQDVRSGRGQTAKQYSARYVCSLVADLHRTLLQGGWCGNPRSHLRMLYEGNPLAFLVEAAGGSASDGQRRVLEIQPGETHQRLPLFLGSREDVAELEGYGDVQQTGAKKYTV
jgi:fructose-1,6-bisphosphatase I